MFKKEKTNSTTRWGTCVATVVFILAISNTGYGVFLSDWRDTRPDCPVEAPWSYLRPTTVPVVMLVPFWWEWVWWSDCTSSVQF